MAIKIRDTRKAICAGNTKCIFDGKLCEQTSLDIQGVYSISAGLHNCISKTYIDREDVNYIKQGENIVERWPSVMAVINLWESQLEKRVICS
jgi:hypothetical protein